MHKTIISLTIIFVAFVSFLSLVFYGETASGNQISLDYDYVSSKEINIKDIFSKEEIEKAKIKTHFPVSEFLKSKKNIPYQKNDKEKYRLDLSIKAAAIDTESGKILYEQDAKNKNSIASITKLITALVVLDQNIDWESYYEIKNEDIVNGGRAHIYKGEKIKLRDLFFLSLIASDNTAAQALAHSTGIENFVEAMNVKVKNMSLLDTSFVDPVGLSFLNLSTAEEVIKIIQEVLRHDMIRNAIFKKDYHFKTLRGREVKVYSTDWLFRKNNENFKHLGGKTGYTESAGYCFAGVFADIQGHEIITVILNSPNINSRFKYAKDLASWIFNSFMWN